MYVCMYVTKLQAASATVRMAHTAMYASCMCACMYVCYKVAGASSATSATVRMAHTAMYASCMYVLRVCVYAFMMGAYFP